MKPTTDFKDLNLVPNMPPAEVEFIFSEPRSFPSKRDPSEMRYAFKLKLLSDHGTFRAGDEVTLWTSNETSVTALRAYGRGDRAVVSYPQEPGDRYATLEVRAMGDLDGPVYTPKAPENGAARNGGRAGASMSECLVEAYMAVTEAAQVIATRLGEGEGEAFFSLATQGTSVEAMAVSLFIQKNR
jgi:hypothetical protein